MPLLPPTLLRLLLFSAAISFPLAANQRFGDAAKDSPMARRGTQTSAFVSLMRSF